MHCISILESKKLLRKKKLTNVCFTYVQSIAVFNYNSPAKMVSNMKRFGLIVSIAHLVSLGQVKGFTS